MRIAFLTDEFVIEKPNSGGLGSFLNRICIALVQAGHEPELFVIRRYAHTPRIFMHRGFRVEHVDRLSSLVLKLLRWGDRTFLNSPWSGPTGYLANALALARAMEHRHLENAFDFVHCPNTSATGLCVRKRKDRPLVVRMSSHRALWFETDGQSGLGPRLMSWLERQSIRRADIAYAPSRYLAEYARKGWRGDVKVVRPPVLLDHLPAESSYIAPPERYLIHFGQIGSRKGSDLIARALKLAWKIEPGLSMIWAGSVIRPGDYEACHLACAPTEGKLTWLGPVEKPLLYRLIKDAVASVLPSRVDNLPNTVIESLMLGTPVIGSQGASIDELVVPDVNGRLVPIGDEQALADAMVAAWRGELDLMRFTPDAFKLPNDFSPAVAAQHLLATVAKG